MILIIPKLQCPYLCIQLLRFAAEDGSRIEVKLREIHSRAGEGPKNGAKGMGGEGVKISRAKLCNASEEFMYSVTRREVAALGIACDEGGGGTQAIGGLMEAGHSHCQQGGSMLIHSRKLMFGHSSGCMKQLRGSHQHRCVVSRSGFGSGRRGAVSLLPRVPQAGPCCLGMHTHGPHCLC